VNTTDRKEGGGIMEKYVCKMCGYIYDPLKGDPVEDVPVGVPFPDLLEDWFCPVCGADKGYFKPL